MDPKTLSEAIVLYTGHLVKSYPQRDSERLIERYGAETGARLLDTVQRLEAEFYEVEPDSRESARGAADRAAEIFATRHPEISAEATAALWWAYGFDWR